MGDFTGGIAARRIGPFHTVLVSYGFGLAATLIAALARGEPLPAPAALGWGALGGLSGMVGLGFLLRGFATGRMGIVAPVSATVATTIPVLVATITEGLPGGLQLLGFGVAMASLWLFSRPEPTGGRAAGLGSALLAGLGFAGFFLALDQVGSGTVFWPLFAGRLSACAALAALVLLDRRRLVPPDPPLELLVPAGVLDVAGNLFFLLAVQSGRLDVAAVVGSLYPAVTALLARAITKERLTARQRTGLAGAVLSIALITL